MTPDALFSIANTLALATWIVLALFQRRRWATDSVATAAVGLFAAAYVTIVAARWFGSSGSFSTLGGVAALFSDPWVLLAGWLHYLAFDLLVGRWEVHDAADRGMSQWLVVPFLALTFMFGPAGWLAYVAGRRLLTPQPHASPAPAAAGR